MIKRANEGGSEVGLLGFLLEESLKGGFMVRHNSESSLVAYMKFKQCLDSIYIGTRKGYVCQMWMV